MTTKPRRRPHLTPAQRDRILEGCQRSNLTRRQFAARAGISVSTLQLWLRQAAVPKAASQAAPFVSIPNLLSAPAEPPFYRLRLPGGLSLEVPSGFQAEELGSLLRTLQAL
jgi:transposase-like protein